ncbi:MAG: type II secretion system protein [Elusimicrobiota bacterium]
MQRLRKHGGYTIIELMIVTVIIGILGTIALQRLGTVMRKSRDSATKGNLGSIRSALSIYYADVLTQHPYEVGALTVNGRYLAEIPKTSLKEYHPDSMSVLNVSSPNGIDDAGGWAYNNDATAPDYGNVWVNCTHTDGKGTAWSTY